MSKAKTLAGTVSAGGALANPTAIPAANIAGLATVATTGSYTDLSDKPTITTTATNLAGGSAGTVPYQSAADTTQMLAVGTAGQVLTSAGAAAPSWANLPSGSEVIRAARISDTALTGSNRGNLIDVTSGTFTQTFVAAATLGSGWFCYIRNSGTGDITLDPNDSETIDGLTSYVMYPGETRLVQCDGTALRTVVLNTFNRTFTSSGTFIKPPGYSQFSGLAWGGGGGGSRSSQYNGSGGGGGGCTPFTVFSSAISASQSVTIAAGGAGASTQDTEATGGGNTTFSIVVAYGGGGGSGNSNGAGGGGILSAASGYQPGEPYSTTATEENVGFGGAAPYRNAVYGGGGGGGYSNGAGGKSVYGGGGGGRTTGSGGTSIFGGNGGGGTSAAPEAGFAPGGGGHGSSVTSGAAGARGELRIWGII